MNDDRTRASWEMTSPRGMAQPTASNPYGSAWSEESEPEIDIMEYVRLVWARKWLVLGVLLSVVVFATSWSMTRPKLYRTSTKFTLTPPPQLSNNQIDSMMNWWQMDRIIADQVQILKTRALAQRVVDRLGLDSHPLFAGGGATGAILGSISAEPIDETFVVEVFMTGSDPNAISEWLNIYIEEYTAANIEDSLGRTRRVYEVIQSRLDPLRTKVSDSEDLLMSFREREDAVLLADQDKNVITEQVNTLTTEYAEAKADRIRLETKLNALRNMRAFTISQTSFPDALKDASVQNLIEQRNDYQGQLTEKLRSLREGHPDIQDLRARIGNLDQQIADQVETIKLSLQTDFEIVSRREQSLFNNIQQLRDQTISLSKQTLELERLERDYDQNKAFLEDMLARSNEADIASTNMLNNVRIIEPARPPGGPFRPNPPRTIALATVVGLFLGIGLVVGLDFLDHTIRSPDDLERYVGLETLSVLSNMTKDNERVLRESFQSLRTAVMLAARGEESHVVMVTSAVPNEGKTTTAYNLAKVLANGGAKVLLIDADLRKPRLHRMINAKNIRGLTSVVLGERTASEVIHRVPNMPDLDLMTSGPLPPNPPELFGKLTFKKLLEEARNIYDWVLIDTPPVAMVTDPVICASSAEIALLVVQYGSTKREIVRDVVRMLGHTGVHIAGAVLNKVDLDRDHHYLSGYYSYARYGYYGDAPTAKSGAHKAIEETSGKAG